MLSWLGERFATLVSPKVRDENAHLDIYGRVVDRGEDFFHPQKFRGIPVFDVDSIIRHYTPQLEKIRKHFDIGDHRHTPCGKPLYDTLVTDIVRRYIEFCHMVPASEDHHHSHTGGLLLHSLEASVESMRWAKERNPKLTGFVDIDYKIKPVMIYCAWLAGLLHDAGKLMRDISIDAVEVLDKNGNLTKPQHTIVSWYPAKESLIEWAKRHNVASYSANFLTGRVHNRHTMDSSQILQPLLRGQYAMNYLLDTPIKQEVYNELTRVLSGYTNSEDYLSESVRIGDSTSTTRSLGYLYDARLGARPISTAQRLYRSIKTAAADWEWNRVEGQGWVIAEDVYIRWTTAIERIIKASREIGYSLPVDVNNILNIMDSNQITDLYDRRYPDDRIIHFTPGKYTQSDIADIQSGKREVTWLYLLKLRGPQIIFSDMPVPFSQAGIVYLPKANVYNILSKDGDLVASVTLENDESEQDKDSPISIPDSGDKATASSKTDDKPSDTQSKSKKQSAKSTKTKKAKSSTKTKSDDTQDKTKPRQLHHEPKQSATPSNSHGIVFHNLPDASVDSNTPEPTKVSAADKTSKTTSTSSTLPDIVSLCRDQHIEFYVVDGYVLAVLSDLEKAFGLKQRTLLSKLEKQGALFIDLAAPTRKTIAHQNARGDKIKCVKLSKAFSDKIQKSALSDTDAVAQSTDEADTVAEESNTELPAATPESDTPSTDDNQLSFSLPAFKRQMEVDKDHPAYQSLLHSLQTDTLVSYLDNAQQLHVIDVSQDGQYYLNPSLLSSEALKTINNARLTNYMGAKNVAYSPLGYPLSLQQLKAIKLDEVSHA
jgi:hypothetical protein